MFRLFTKRYNVDYGQSMFLFKKAKKSYKAGKKVTLYFDCIATDTDYHFYLDNDALNFTYDQKKGYIIKFIMPNHDVKLRVETNNSMYACGVTSCYTRFGLSELTEPNHILISLYTSLSASDSETNTASEIIKSTKHILKTTDDSAILKLEYHTKSNNGTESLICYYVPSIVAEDCYQIITDDDFSNWYDESICIDGVYNMCKFYDNGKYIQISTKCMPNKRIGVFFNDLSSLLNQYMTEKYQNKP